MEEVMKELMKQRTLSALEGSIDKWGKIVYNGGLDEGATNCPLCTEFLLGDSCSNCPISKKTGKSACYSTPFTKWYNHQSKVHHSEVRNHIHLGCDECEKLAIDELAFLISLRPKKQDVEEPKIEYKFLCFDKIGYFLYSETKKVIPKEREDYINWFKHNNSSRSIIAYIETDKLRKVLNLVHFP